ncbi:hypothetical protein KJA15_03045 [Patescibacteria group bacterium]|nr:hypothetical protein [Patescibacteria group bacterium]
MKTKILIALIILIGFGIGGFFVWKNISLPEAEKEKIEEEKEAPEEQVEEQAVLPEEEEEEEVAFEEEVSKEKLECPFGCCFDEQYKSKSCPSGYECKENKCVEVVEVEKEKLPSVWTIEGVVIPGGYCDAEVVKLPDGRYRMYYGLDPRTYPENINIVSAISSDGLNWTSEPGTRLPEGFNYAMPSVIELPDGRFRMYYNSGGIQSAISNDGLNFQVEGLRLVTDLVGPTVIRLDDGRYRMYLQDCDEPAPPTPPVCRIKSAISSDGLSWGIEPGIRIDGTKPLFYGMFANMIGTSDIVKLSDGSFRLYFLAGSQEMDEEGMEGIYSADSADGLSFSNITFLFGKYIDEEGREVGTADPCVVEIEEGWRVYFASDCGPFSTGISSAIIADLLP